ncbi:hypothetical protein C8R44DRAFT_380902 [Mycena epipterygia]|nr:hypothetical protein C8R44DRAFT_380902 [Mycena epipterygia]
MNPGLAALLKSNCAPTAEQALEIRDMLDAARLVQLDERPELGVPIHHRSQLLRSLEGALSALRSFPAEILGHIFIFCRDDSLSIPEYSTADTTSAPMVLCHVCSRWRTVSHDTPRLWDTVCFPESAFTTSADGPAWVQRILQRSRAIPLSVNLTLEPSSEPLPSDGNHRSFDTVWDSHRRLQSVSMDITADEAMHLFPPKKMFPILSSIDLSFFSNISHEVDLPTLLESFEHTPALRSVAVQADYSGNRILHIAFPWSQLTHLVLQFSITTDVARDILVQCTMLESAVLYKLCEPEDDPKPPQHICTLENLRRLELFVIMRSGAIVILAAIALPRLESLAISADDHLTPAILALHGHSQFTLAHLSLTRVHLSPEELITLLHVLPALQTLTIHGCSCIGDSLFELLTCGPALSGTHLRLPFLTTLRIYPLTPNLDGNIVANTVESLSQCIGRTDMPFPALREICLYRGSANDTGPTFGDDLERRLAAVCATGFLVDRFPRFRGGRQLSK